MLQRVCVDHLNRYSQSYNVKLQTLLTDLQKSLPDSKIAYFGIYDAIMDMINYPAKYGMYILSQDLLIVSTS